MAIWDLEMQRMTKGYPVAFKSAKQIAKQTGASTSTVNRALRFFGEQNVVTTVAGKKGGKHTAGGRRIDFAALLRWLSAENGPQTGYLSEQLERLAVEHPVVEVADKRGNPPIN